MSHIGSACHCLFGCDRADYEWEGECCIAWVKWHLQISDRFDQCEDVDYSSDNKHCHQEVIILRHNGLYIACDTETCRCGVDTDQRFCRIRKFFELHIAVCYQYLSLIHILHTHMYHGKTATSTMHLKMQDLP